MPPADRPSCSSLSRAFHEEQAATASRYRFWLMVEQPGPWGHDALLESRFPVELGARLRELEGRLGLRTLLIKRRDRPDPEQRRCFAAFTGSKERRLVTFDVSEPARLLDLDIPSLVRSRFRGLGEELTEPLFLVCTHGKHDACCARHGAPLYRALAGSRDGGVWEATHVGGDRFAGNVVCFPHGMYFGRVVPAEGRAVADAYARGEVLLDLYRGRSAYSPPIQAAEHFLRRETGLLGVDSLVLAGHRTDGTGHAVEFRVDEARYTVEVEAGASHARPLTCKALHPHRPRVFALRSVERRPVAEEPRPERRHLGD
jgi:hypothetical protein